MHSSIGIPLPLPSASRGILYKGCYAPDEQEIKFEKRGDNTEIKRAAFPWLLMAAVTMLVVPAACTPTPKLMPSTATASPEYEIKTTPEGVKHIVDPEKTVGGGPPKDGIPSIDRPKFISVVEAKQWLQDNESVLAIIYKGITRVYPLQVVVWHEIVTDSIAGDPILITYCPLCGYEATKG